MNTWIYFSIKKLTVVTETYLRNLFDLYSDFYSILVPSAHMEEAGLLTYSAASLWEALDVLL